VRARYAAGAQPAAPAPVGDAAISENGPTERVTLTRRELEALIDEAIRRDRSLR